MSIVSLPFSDEGYAQGQNAGNYAAQLADKAADFACGLARTYPGAVIGNAAGSAVRGFWDGMCRNRGGAPPPAERPVNGGQCPVEYWFNYSTGANPRVIGPNGENAFAAQMGPLNRFRVTGIINEDVIDGVKYVNYAAEHWAGNTVLFQGSAVGFEGDAPVLVTRRVDGLPDTCGDDPGGYPDDTFNPPPGWNQGNTVINTENNIGVVIPIIYTPINVGVDVGVNLNVGGVNVRLDLGGVTLNFNPSSQPGQPGYPGGDQYNFGDKIDNIFNDNSSGSGGFTASDRNVLNNTNSLANSLNSSVGNLANSVNNLDNKVEAVDEKADEILDKIDEIETCCNESSPDNPDEFDKDEKTEEDDKKEEGVPQLSFVKIQLTKLPEQSKIQWGEGSPNVTYAGWFEWIVAGFALPRQPIHFQKSIFAAPSYADGYAYTLVNGATGRATVYKRKVTS